jgi:hypothetical protein
MDQGRTALNQTCHLPLLFTFCLVNNFVGKADYAVQWSIHFVADVGGRQI